MSTPGPADTYRLVCQTTRVVPMGRTVQRQCAECDTPVWVSLPNLLAVADGLALPTCVGCVRRLAADDDSFHWMFGPHEEQIAAEVGILGQLRQNMIRMAAGTMTPVEHLDSIVGDRW